MPNKVVNEIVDKLIKLVDGYMIGDVRDALVIFLSSVENQHIDLDELHRRARELMESYCAPPEETN